MGRIVAIGGGEIKHGDTERIDRYSVLLTGKTSPNLLFIPTASNDAAGYIKTIKEIFSSYGCIVDALTLVNKQYKDDEIRQMIEWADIIYVGGGNTASMLKIWRNFYVDKYLQEAYQRGTVLTGLSAGSICWFTFGHSDSQSFDTSDKWEYSRVYGLGLLPLAHCPHYNEEGRESFDDMMKEEKLSGIALDNNVALIELDGEYQILKADRTKKAYLLKNTVDGLIKKELPEGVISLPE